MEKKFKRKSVTLALKQSLVEFMEANPELNKEKFSSTFTHKISQNLWNKITVDLNSMIGATKTADKWRKVLIIITYIMYSICDKFVYYIFALKFVSVGQI
jgi:hypothetical protein